MQTYRHILATTDLSDINRPAIRRAAALADALGSDLTLLHIIEHFPQIEPLASIFEENTRLVDQLVDNARRRLVKAMDELGVGNANAEIRLTVRSARHEILRFAQEQAVDLIVVAPHGRGFMGTLGSTAMGVVNAAEREVLVVRDEDGE